MTEKGLNLFDICAPMYICAPMKKRYTLLTARHSNMYTTGTIANWPTDRASTKINKNDAVVKVRILVELGIL